MAVPACHSTPVHHDDATSTSPQPGHALAANNGFYFTLRSVPGDEWALQVAYLENTSSMPLTLQAARAVGAGVGTVVRTELVRVAPPPTSAADRNKWVPSVVFKAFPPAVRTGNGARCHIQRITPVPGYVLQPGAHVHLVLLMRAVHPATFFLRDHIVTYRQSGGVFSQPLASGVKGTVVAGGKPFAPSGPFETYCFGRGATELPTGR